MKQGIGIIKRLTSPCWAQYFPTILCGLRRSVTRHLRRLRGRHRANFNQDRSSGASGSLETTDDGASYYTQTTSNSGSIPCFTAGTDICTPIGNAKVEDLKAGDLIDTSDGDQSVLLAVYSRTRGRGNLNKSPKLFPLRISAGTLGADCRTAIWWSRASTGCW